MSNFREAYSYDEKTKLWLGPLAGVAKAWESPLEEGVFPLPSCSTFEKPEPKEGEVAIFNGSKWNYLIESDKKTFWHNETLAQIAVFNDPRFYPGEDYTDQKPDQITRREEVQKIFDDVKDAGAIVSALRERALRSVMDSLATKKEKDALKKLDAAIAHIQELSAS